MASFPLSQAASDCHRRRRSREPGVGDEIGRQTRPPSCKPGLPIAEAGYASGVRHFDTAAGYGDGRSEEIYGDCLSGRRREIFLASKAPKVHISDGFSKTEATYYGAPTEAKARIYHWHFGNVGFELLQPLAPKSVWQDWLDEHGPSVHHVAFRVTDTAGVAREFVRHGYPVLQQGSCNCRPNGGHTGMYTYLVRRARSAALRRPTSEQEDSTADGGFMHSIGILGAAGIAPRAIIEPARRRSDVVIGAVASRRADKASAYAASNGIPVSYGDYGELFGRSGDRHGL